VDFAKPIHNLNITKKASCLLTRGFFFAYVGWMGRTSRKNFQNCQIFKICQKSETNQKPINNYKDYILERICQKSETNQKPINNYKDYILERICQNHYQDWL